MERNDTNKCNCQMFGTTSLLSRTQKLNENKDKEKKPLALQLTLLKKLQKKQQLHFVQFCILSIEI